MRASSILAVALFVAVTSGCTVHKTEAPSLSGPSEFALSLSMTATPDSIAQDGGSQSSIRITARGPDGRPIASLPMRVDMTVHGEVRDFGTLSARTIVTGSDGVASVTYTAPPRGQDVNSGTCAGLPGTCVTIVATPTGSNFQTANPQTVEIRLAPLGVILPPVGKPTASFIVTNPASVAVPLVFDASSSDPGQNSSQIASYSWNFGDGTTDERTSPRTTHTYTSGGTFHVTLTVTNDRGVSSDPAVQDVTVGTADPFTGDWTFSPTAPIVGDPVFFNAAQVQTSAGHDVTQYSWDFGDGATASGVVTSHTYSVAGTFNVVLSVTDDLGRKKVFSPKQVSIGNGSPVAAITFSPTSPHVTDTLTFDASGSAAASGATITGYAWNFGDGSTSSSGPTTSHKYSSAGSFTVRVTVTDNQGRTGTATITVTVAP
jgi:PKD repeat protein